MLADQGVHGLLNIGHGCCGELGGDAEQTAEDRSYCGGETQTDEQKIGLNCNVTSRYRYIENEQ